MVLPHPKLDRQKLAAAFDAQPYTTTQQDIADAAGISRVAVSFYKRGVSMPSAKTLPRLAAALGYTEDELLTD